jgi:hypothetical protein
VRTEIAGCLQESCNSNGLYRESHFYIRWTLNVVEMKTNRTKKRSLLQLIVPSMVLFVVLAWSIVSAIRVQQQAISGLNDAARSALTLRGGGRDNFPSFSVHHRTTPWLEEIAGPTLFGRVSDVSFRQSDDQQILESIPHLQSLIGLNRVMFDSPPSQSVLLKVRESLPGVMLVDEKAAPLP